MKSWTRIMHVCSHFSGFSVGCCINREKVYLLPTWVREIVDVSTECSSRHQSESGRSVNNVAIYSQALLRIHVIGGQRSVRIALPFLSPHHSSPATRDFQSSISVEALFCRCHLDVQGLLYQQLLSFAVVQYGGLLPGTQQDNHLSSLGLLMDGLDQTILSRRGNIYASLLTTQLHSSAWSDSLKTPA